MDNISLESCDSMFAETYIVHVFAKLTGEVRPFFKKLKPKCDI
jgi:hypothetical protein